MVYAETDSRLLGGIPVRAEDELQAFYDDAADEMDIVLGWAYVTPITLAANGTDPLPRPMALTLKRINRYLASGRYILAVAAGGEDTTLQAYGARLVKEALDALTAIVEGDMALNAKRLVDVSREREAPKIYNWEPKSNVDSFYEAFTRDHQYGWGSQTSDDDRQMFRDHRRTLAYGSAELEYDEDADSLAGLEGRGD